LLSVECGLRNIYTAELGQGHWRISPAPLWQRGVIPPFRKREGRRDFADRCLYYFENINKTRFGQFGLGTL